MGYGSEEQTERPGPGCTRLSRSDNEPSNSRDVAHLRAVVGKIGASGEVLALQPSVLVGATLPRTLQIAEVHLDPGVNPQPGVLDISAPWSQFLERRNCSDSVVIAAVIASRTASAPCPLSAGPCLILGPSRPSIGGRRQVQQHGVPAGPLDQRADRRAAKAEDQITLRDWGRRSAASAGC